MKSFLSFAIVSIHFSIMFLPFIAQAQPDLRDEITHELKKIISPHVFSLKDEKSFFHYTTRGSVNQGWPDDSQRRITRLTYGVDEALPLSRFGTYDGPVEIENSESYSYYAKLAASFYSAIDKWTIGPGFYAAVDPVQSERYLGNPGALLELIAPIGSKYLDIRNGPFRIGVDAYRRYFQFYLPNLKLTDGAYEAQYNDFYLGPEENRNNRIPQLFQRALRELKVSFIVYEWDSEATMSFCKERMRNKWSAVNFIDPDLKNSGLKIKTYVPSGPIEDEDYPSSVLAYENMARLIERAEVIFHKITLRPISVISRVMARQWLKKLINGSGDSFDQSVFSQGNVYDEFYRFLFQEKGVLAVATPNTSCLQSSDAKSSNFYRCDPSSNIQKQDPELFAYMNVWMQRHLFECE